MKKLVSSLFVAAALVPLSLFAADPTVSGLKGGTATVTAGDAQATLSVGSTIPNGGSVTTTGTIGVNLSDGSTIYLGPGSTFSISTDSSGVITVTLLSGSVSGTFPSAASIIVRTPLGTVAPAGASCSIVLPPPQGSGPATLVVAAAQGTPVVTPLGTSASPIPVPAGSALTLGGGVGTSVAIPLTPTQAVAVNNAISGNPNGISSGLPSIPAGTPVPVTISTATLPVPQVPRVDVTTNPSSAGEGVIP